MRTENPTMAVRLIIFSQPSVFMRGNLHAQLVLPLTSTNTKLVQIFSTFECRNFARVPGALHARERYHKKQWHPCTPSTQKNNAGRQKSALSKPPPRGPWAISRENVHNAPKAERRSGPRALQILPAVGEDVQEPRGRGRTSSHACSRCCSSRG